MNKSDALEAAPIVQAALDALLVWTPLQGRPGIDLRTAIGDTKAHLADLIQSDTVELALIKCFDLAYTAGIDLAQMEMVRLAAVEQTAVSLGAIMVRDTIIELAFATSGYIIGRMDFVSKEDVDRVKMSVNAAFVDMEDAIADRQDSMTWRALLKLHAAISMHLVETARPLPRMLSYRFYLALPSLTVAQRLYADASRADEVREENKIVHPAFCPRAGRALSA